MSYPAGAPATGFVLAGGVSRRMGRDKALLRWGSSTLLDHALARLHEVCPEVRVLCGAQRRYADRGVPVLVDLTAETGPLGGVLTGLSEMDTDMGLFLGVDLPFVPSALLAWMAEVADTEAAEAVVPLLAARPHPLCAAYRRSCLEPIQRRLRKGELKMTAFWPDVSVRQVSEAELARFGDPSHLLRNLNTLDDYEEALRSAT